MLEKIFEAPRVRRVAPAAVSKNKNTLQVIIEISALAKIPEDDRIDRKAGGVVRVADADKGIVENRVVDAVRNDFPKGVAWKIVVIDRDGRLSPSGAVLIKIADQLLFLGVNADDRLLIFLEKIAHLFDLFELCIAIRMRFTRQAFAIAYERDFVFLRV